MVFGGATVSYEITFLENDIYRDPFEYGIGDLYESGSFTFYINKKAVATARSLTETSSVKSRKPCLTDIR
jgi:hypothetical protein